MARCRECGGSGKVTCGDCYGSGRHGTYPKRKSVYTAKGRDVAGVLTAMAAEKPDIELGPVAKVS
jgi:hypothetical protein